MEERDVVELKPCPFCGGGNVGDRGNAGSLLSWWEVYCCDCQGKQMAYTRDEAIDAWNRRAAPVPTPEHTEAQVERVAQAINPTPFRQWQSMYDYCLREGDSDLDAIRYADDTYLAACEGVLGQARAAIAAMAPGDERIERAREALEQVRLTVEDEAYKVTEGQQPCKHTAALNEIHDLVRSALADLGGGKK